MGEARTEKKQEQQEAEDLVLEGRTWKFGDDIDTDIIIPTQHLTYPSMEEIKKHAFEPLRPELAAQLREGDIIVAGNNFGCGSSREQAAEVILANGVHCIVAKSFARIFFRNAINNGILLIESPDLADHIQEGDRIRVDLKKQEIIANGQHFPIPAIPENLYRIIADGGLVKNVEKRMKAQGGRA
ncbi:3-isopropylmalate dehydratase [Acidaminococcus timonensis]|uniref:LeuD/DmdB family oxidoreductase small subunit n=1 Tax=Acidaminococcus timonensis TaxID=1871002 RepID=UPI003C6D4FDA